jgi:micrococcal nuclease
MRPLIFLIILCIPAISCNSRSGKRLGGQETSTYYSVTKVVDGDTFWIDNGTSEGEKIRLIGVDAPESRKTGKKDIGYFGLEAKKYLTGLLDRAKIRLEYDVGKKDRYGRTLAYVYLENGVFLNEELIKEGYAMVMTVPPNVKFAEHFVTLQAEARESKKGLWNDEH